MRPWSSPTSLFRHTSSIRLLCMPPPVCFYFTKTKAFCIEIRYPRSCCSIVPSVSGWLWISVVRSGNVRKAGLRKRRYNSCLCSDRLRLPCVRPSIYRYQEGADRRRLFSPVLLWKYGKRIRMSSKYAYQGQAQNGTGNATQKDVEKHGRGEDQSDIDDLSNAQGSVIGENTSNDAKV